MEKEKTNNEQESDTNSKAENTSVSNETEGGEKAAPVSREGSKKQKKGVFSRSKKDDNLVAELEQKIAELNDKYLRIFSEYDNYRKRTLREKSEMARNAASDLIIELLSIIDDLERAIEAGRSVSDCDAIRNGIELIYSKLMKILEKRGVKPIETVGKEFTTDFHEAVTQIPAEKEEMKGKVVEEIEKGYLLHDKVIRYSKVVISN